MYGYYLFFFFKQKTAYEMRISDWSSDVCSSDLEGDTITAQLPAGIRGGFGPNLRRFCLMMHAHGQVTTQRMTTLLNDVGVEISKRQVVRFLTERLEDRKSVVLGKSVSVRVDLGGRRIIKKTNCP